MYTFDWFYQVEIGLHYKDMNNGLLEITFGIKIYEFVVLVAFLPIFGSLLAAFAGQFDLTMVQDILMFDFVR